MGGQAFKDDSGTILTRRIEKKDVLPTIQWLETVTGLELTDHLLGTTGKAASSGDLDIAIDATAVDKNEFASRLQSYIADQGNDPKKFVKKSGVSVHFMTPIKGDPEKGYVQADFMFGDRDWMKWAMRGGQEGSEYKGSHRHVLLASIARARGMKWSPQNGLMTGDGKEMITKDPNEIAKKLLGVMATHKNIEHTEDILNFIQKFPDYENLVKDARETLGKEGIKLPETAKLESHQTGTPGWFRRMMEAVK
jgi:hypothetical protein